jgi:hypothetical protein
MLVLEDLEGEVITGQRQPELKKKAAYFRVRQMREGSFHIPPASFSPRPNDVSSRIFVLRSREFR